MCHVIKARALPRDPLIHESLLAESSTRLKRVVAAFSRVGIGHDVAVRRQGGFTRRARVRATNQLRFQSGAAKVAGTGQTAERRLRLLACTVVTLATRLDRRGVHVESVFV